MILPTGVSLEISHKLNDNWLIAGVVDLAPKSKPSYGFEVKGTW